MILREHASYPFLLSLYLFLLSRTLVSRRFRRNLDVSVDVRWLRRRSLRVLWQVCPGDVLGPREHRRRHGVEEAIANDGIESSVGGT